MNSDELKQDDFLKGLVLKSDLETPSTDFTLNVMTGINYAGSKPYYLNIQKSTFYLIPVLSVLVLSISWFLFPYLKDLVMEYFDPFFVSFLKGVLHNFSNLFQKIHISSTTIAIIISIFGLFAFDIFFNKKRARKFYLFSI
ncbi:MAG: hypothetical protein DRJ05_03495 [Bacteroidetes bacterium]|nr:MAG: hypothetical protein DRJ05_03495 [Bacteroidota bacterium]